MLSSEGLLSLLTSGVQPGDERLVYEGSAPSRNRVFSRWDIDSDGTDEIFLTGRGGAGGTSLLYVFKVSEEGVRRIYVDGSRFGFTLVDTNRDGAWEILNPGFEFEIHDDHILRPRQFFVNSLKHGQYEETGVIDASAARTMLEEFSERVGFPLSDTGRKGIVRVFERPR